MPSEYTYKITPAAARDIDSILAYITNDLCAPESAVALLDEIENAVSAACVFPESHALVAEPLLALRGYRKLIVKNYLVIYSIDEREAALNIIRVVYGARDYQKEL